MRSEVARPLGTAMDLPVWQDDVQRVFRQLFSDADATLSGAFSPALDVEESDNDFTLHIEVPGVKPDDVEVSIEENVLTIAGSRDFYDERAAEGFRRIERRFGRFHRAVRLPDRVDPDGVSASYKDGMLTVTVPKSESAKPRKVAIATE
ncbi:MAG: Hsp20/alpha crystallin family protein [Demequinaceae bacterium]|nr:Hsp20/alpha crystallin family protein [Demequinaceae bacterium]